MPLSVILAEPEAIFRNGVASVLRSSGRVNLLAECTNLSALEAELDRAKDAVVLFSHTLSSNSALLAQSIELAGGLAVMILPKGSAHFPVLIEGLRGCIHRDVGARDLLLCIERVAAGGRWMQPEKIRETSARKADPAGERVLRSMTPKELEIVALVADGGKNREIAEKLHTTEQVIKNYLRSIYDKAGVSDRLELTLYTVHHAAFAEALATLKRRRS